MAKVDLFFAASTHTYNDVAAYALSVQQTPSILTSSAFQQLYGPVVQCMAELTAQFAGELPTTPALHC